jgi:hypothetical protein
MAGLAGFLQLDWFRLGLFRYGFEFVFIFFRRTSPFLFGSEIIK